MADYVFPEHISGDTFHGVRFALSNQNGFINFKGASISLVTDRSETLSTGKGNISIVDAKGGIFEIKEQIISWKPAIYRYALIVTFPGGKIKTYLQGSWKIVGRF